MSARLFISAIAFLAVAYTGLLAVSWVTNLMGHADTGCCS